MDKLPDFGENMENSTNFLDDITKELQKQTEQLKIIYNKIMEMHNETSIMVLDCLKITENSNDNQRIKNAMETD